METLLEHAKSYQHTKNAEKQFVEKCKDMEEQIKQNEEAAKSQLSVFLKEYPSAKLRNGKYLTLKTSVSKKRLNPDHVREGVMSVDKNDMKTFQNSNPNANQTECIAAVVEEKLKGLCSTVTHTPRIVSGAPKNLPKGTFTVSAPMEIEDLCAQLKDTQEKLKTVREHKKTGKKQCTPALDEQQDAVSRLLDSIAPVVDPASSAVEIRLVPAPSLEMDGNAVDLPELPMGDDAPVMVEKKGNKKRKAPVFEAVVKGLEKPIKIKRKQKQAKGQGNTSTAVEVEDFAYAFEKWLAEQHVTINKFFKDQSVYCEHAVEVFQSMIPIALEPVMLSEYDISIN